MLTTEDAIKIKDLDSIASHHREEWVKSAVNSNIIELNVRTIYDSRELDKIINRNNKRRWKHSDELVPAWCVSGIDPLTDEPTLQGVQVKPDKPPVNADGKIQKYLGAKDFEASPLFLDTGTPWFWKDTIDNVSTPVLITEGAKKAASALTLGIPAISIPGVATCRKKGRLHQNLELFAKPGRTFYLGFDNDLLIKEQVQKALIGLGRELAACGAKVMVLRLPEGEAKGIDDYIALHGEEAFRELFINPSTFEEWLDEIKNQEVETEEYQPKSRLARYDNIIKNNWGQYLRYNTLKKRVELHGRDLKADKVRLYAARQFDIDISTNDVLSIVRDLAELESYSPVLEYLDECAAKFPDTDPSFLDGLAKQYFGSDNPTHAIYFKKFLVSAVARARRPGCKVDTVFMLVSPKQGVYKSTFFRLLFGEGFFSDQLGGDISDKDEKMKMHRFWCLEWSEFEAVYKRKDIATLKNFITSVEDTFRAPYDREPETYLRPCVFVGTSNEQEILHDPTGDRRFWIVPVTVDKIPVRQVLKDRDKIWASANALYQSGFQWRLTDEEELARAELNKAYQGTDYWDEIIEQLFLDSQPTNWISTESIIKRLGFENARQLDAGSQARLTKTMTRLGFEKKILRINGSQKRGWQKVARDSTTFDKNIDSGVTVSQPMHNETFSRDTTVTPPVTGVTQPEINTVTPVTPPVTEVSQPKFLQNKECDTVTPETASNPKIIKTDEAIASPNAQHPTPNDQGVNEEGAIDPKNPANEAGKKEFRVGDSVIVFDSKNIDLIGTVQTIKHLNERSIIFESGG
ncbi:MAG TPA: VapE domain-containing protein, partial [Leptolyngbyaceae cyanobacterium]